MANRTYSFLILGEDKLALEQLMRYQKHFPWSRSVPPLAMMFVAKMGLGVVKKLFMADLLQPTRVLAFIGLAVCLFIPLFWVYPVSESVIATVLMLMILCENYINSRSLMTINKITYTGIVVALCASLILKLLGQPILAGTIIIAVIAPLLTLIILILLVYLPTKGALALGTIKLFCMISAFIGFKIIGVFTLWAVIRVATAAFTNFQKSRQGSLKWKQKGLYLGEFSFSEYATPLQRPHPTSSYLWLATWIVLMVSPIIGDQKVF
jgi:hypothetical protein